MSDEQQQSDAAAFPEDTPVKDMAPEQQAAYWRDKAQKHEGMWKAYADKTDEELRREVSSLRRAQDQHRQTFGKLTAEELTALRDKAEKHDAMEHELASDMTKAVTEAKKTTQDEADSKYKPLLAETAFRVAIGDRKSDEEVDEFIGDLNLTRFLTDDGKVDTAKVLARVDQFAPVTGAQQNQQRRGPSPTGQGNSSGNQRSAPGTGSVSAGRDLYAETHPKKAS